MHDVTERFSDRVANYVRFRPDYPAALPQWLADHAGMAPGALIADVGAGTGITSKMLLNAGRRVVAVEPNAPMREAAVAWLGDEPGFTAVDGRAEATTLASHSVDGVIAGQAFHWFDQEAARAEFARIVRPGGFVALFWNSRRLTGTPFLEGYEKLLHDYGVDYTSVAERHADDEAMHTYFGESMIGKASFPHGQRLDYAALEGRLLSSSYVPQAGSPAHSPMLQALRELFDATSTDGHVDFDYDTRVYAGRIA
jgi:SAM-dependent methyltransferase